MPPIKQNQVIDKSVEKAFIDLNEAIKVTLKQLDLLLKDGKEIQSTFGNATGIKSYTEALQKLEKNRKEANTLTKQQIELLKKEEALKQSVARTTAAQEKAIQAKNRTAEQERKIAERQTKQAARLTGAYARQSKTLTLLRNRAKNLAITYGENSKQFLQAEKRVVALDSKMKKLDARLGQSQREVGNYSKALGGLKNLLGAAGVAGGATILISGLKKMGEEWKKNINIQQKIRQQFKLSGDQLKSVAKDVQVITNVFDADYNEVIKSANALSKEFGITANESLDLIKEGFEKGADNSGEFLEILKEYPAQLKTVGLNARQTIALITQTVDEGVFSDKGVDAIKEAGLRLREMPKATAEALNGIGLSSLEIERALKDGTKSIFEVVQQVSGKLAELPPQSAKVGTAIADIFGGAGEDAGLRYLTTLKDIDLELSNLESNTDPYIESQRDLTEAWTELVLTWQGADGILTNLNKGLSGLLISIQALTGEIKGETLSGWEKFWLRAQVLVGGTNAALAASEIAVNNLVETVKEESAAEEAANKIKEETARLLNNNTEVRKKDLESIKSRGQITIDTEKEIQSELVETTKVFEDAEKLKTEIQKEELQKRSDAEKEFQEALKDSVIEIGNALFEIKQEQLTQESERIAEEFDTRLANEKLDEEQRSLIEAERTQEQNELARKQREIEKKQFLFNQGVKVSELGVDTALKVAEIKTTAALLASNPATLPFVPLALSQIPLVIGTGAAGIAAILAKSVPAFDKGTDNTPKDYIAGEKGTEIKIDRSGKASLITSPTLFTNDPGNTIISTAKTADILDNVSRQEINHNILNSSNPVQDAMLADAVNQAFEKHSNRMVREMRNNRPSKDNASYRELDLRRNLRNSN